jgi:hypothetical protein
MAKIPSGPGGALEEAIKDSTDPAEPSGGARLAEEQGSSADQDTKGAPPRRVRIKGAERLGARPKVPLGAPAAARPDPAPFMYSPAPPKDPAGDAAALLRRLGFATLMLAVPVASLTARRGAVLLVPIALILIILAAVLDGAHRKVFEGLREAVVSPAGLAGGVLLLWCALSLLWTPFQGRASERLLGVVATLAIGLAGYLALPDRMRSANLYLLPVGAGLAALVAAAVALLGGVDTSPEEQTLVRGLVVLILLLWPALAWLRSRQRHTEALVLAVAVASAAALGPDPLPLAALAVGAGVYALTGYRLRLGVRLTATAMAALLVLAPLVPFLLRPLNAVLERGNPFSVATEIWRRVILNDATRMITGHGFETAMRGRGTLLPVNAPTTFLFEVWYDLGVIGALAGAAALYFGAMRAGREDPPLVPAIMAAFATAFALAAFGIGTGQMWWYTSLVALVLIFVAVERGPFRTTRPKANFLRPVNDR